MSKPLSCWVVWGFSFSVAGSAFAQAADTSGSVSLSSKDGASSDASASAAAPTAEAPKSEAPKAAAEPFDPYEPGLPPEGNVLELGVFGGAIFPSSDHNLRYEAYPQQPYSTGAEIGARLGYYPTSFLGLEGEAMTAASKIKDTETSANLYALRGHVVLQAPLPYVAPFLLVGVGRLGAISRSMANDSDPAWHFGIGAKLPLTHLLSARLDLRDTLTQKTQQDGQAHTFEILLGLSATVERSRKEPPPPPPDSDHDGFLDSDDQCPAEAGVAPRGCPADTDTDGVLDKDDFCPREAGPAPKGCPDPDPDHDGILLPCDQCPKEVGVKPDGCPIRDKDGDGIFDDKDKCVDKPETKNGFEDEDGCPDNVPDAVKKFSGVIEGIYFDKGKATVRAQSKTVLASAAKVLQTYPSINLEISGHTSSEGDAAVNQRLSQERADAVKQWLVDNGVPPERLKTRGAGPDEPIADNKTAPGREKNRRIEFKVLQ
ncbi:MAG TPA: OmpA family protein [Polyangiaceae bacterium]|nr:OmpA family protein [Polyangiaceae bacterium]